MHGAVEQERMRTVCRREYSSGHSRRTSIMQHLRIARSAAGKACFVLMTLCAVVGGDGADVAESGLNLVSMLSGEACDCRLACNALKPCRAGSRAKHHVL